MCIFSIYLEILDSIIILACIFGFLDMLFEKEKRKINFLNEIKFYFQKKVYLKLATVIKSFVNEPSRSLSPLTIAFVTWLTFWPLGSCQVRMTLPLMSYSATRPYFGHAFITWFGLRNFQLEKYMLLFLANLLKSSLVLNILEKNFFYIKKFLFIPY